MVVLWIGQGLGMVNCIVAKMISSSEQVESPFVWQGALKKYTLERPEVRYNLLVKEANLDVAEGGHLLQTADCSNCGFAVQHLTTDSIQVVSSHLISVCVSNHAKKRILALPYQSD